MGKRMAITTVALFFMVSVSGFFALPDARAQEITRITVGGSGPGATAYILAGGLAELINTRVKHPKLRLTAQTTRGFVENSRLVDTGQMDMGMNSAPLLYAHNQGSKPFQQKAQNVRVGVPVGTSAHQWATFRKSGIKTISDLAGKRVSIGPRGSSTAVQSERILQEYGILEKVQVNRLGWDEAARALQDGKLDAYGITSTLPTPSVVETAAQGELYLIPMDKDKLESLKKKYPGYFSFNLKAGSYDGQKEDVLCLGYNFYLIANKDLVPAWVMYDITKSLLDPQWRSFLLSLPTRGYAALDFAPDIENLGIAGVPLHAGNIKYWEEKGVKIPKALIPPEYK
ncbi:MAG: TAXI family TRAP transporter solute-binding subunit [Thermodesulfobacteriota bacterium]